MNVAIVGSRDFHPRWRVWEVVDGLPAGTTVISGGARGPDRWAVERAIERGLAVRVYPADWGQYGRAAGPIRNARVVSECEQLIAFWDGSSRGTADVVAKAEAAGKPVTVVRADPSGASKEPVMTESLDPKSSRARILDLEQECERLERELLYWKNGTRILELESRLREIEENQRALEENANAIDDEWAACRAEREWLQEVLASIHRHAVERGGGWAAEVAELALAERSEPE